MFISSLQSSQLECSPHMHKRTVRKKMERRGRFRTQPVTFMEIKVGEVEKQDDTVWQEVDEDKVEDPLTGLSGNSSDFSDNEKSSSLQVRCPSGGLR